MSATSFKMRKICARLVGQQLTAYILHLRPLEWPIITIHFFVGIALSNKHININVILLGWLTFVFFLNGGTLAINSAFDNDDGDIGYLRNPPKPPKYLLHFSAAMLTISLVLCLKLSKLFAYCNITCILMSLMYSVPPLRLKARAGWDLVINCIGFGLLTPMSGYALANKAIPSNALLIMIGFMFLFAALYPLTQLYQVTEDKQRGDFTFVVMIGSGLALMISISAVIIAHICFIYSIFQIANSYINIMLITTSLTLWLLVLVPWSIKHNILNSKQQESRMYQALAVWAITDIIFLVILGYK